MDDDRDESLQFTSGYMPSSMPPPKGTPGGNDGKPNGPDCDHENQETGVISRPDSIAREIPEPLLMHQRRIDADNMKRGSSSSGGGKGGDGDVCAEAGADTGKEKPAENKDDPDRCVFCLENLPDVSRGVIPCGHTFCFTCIHTWVKQQSTCPLCNKEVRYITKTLTKEEINKENRREERRQEIAQQQGKDVGVKLSRSQRTRRKRGKQRCIEHEGGVMTKKMRVRPCSRKDRIRNQMRHAPHPQGPGGSLHNNPTALEEVFAAYLPTSATARAIEAERRDRGAPLNPDVLRIETIVRDQMINEMARLRERRMWLAAEAGRASRAAAAQARRVTSPRLPVSASVVTRQAAMTRQRAAVRGRAEAEVPERARPMPSAWITRAQEIPPVARPAVGNGGSNGSGNGSGSGGGASSSFMG